MEDYATRKARLEDALAGLNRNTSKGTVTVPTLDKLKDILVAAVEPALRKRQADGMFGSIATTDPQEDRSEAGILRRVNAYLYSDAELDNWDRDVAGRSFPLELTVLDAPDQTISGQYLIDQGGLAVINWGTVTMADQSYITVLNTQLQFTAATIVRNGKAPASQWDFNILGNTGAPGSTPTAAGSTGSAGGVGSNGTCTGGGGISGGDGGTGVVGGTGATGGAGGQGGNGLPSLAATITITSGFSGAGFLSFATRSGTGGAGGSGGQGGPGGPGGQGGPGANCACEGTSGGNGGVGGAGGMGGGAGPGGPAVNASGNIQIFVPAAQVGAIVTSSAPVPGGPAGSPGAAGAGGPGGGGGSGGKHQGDGNGATGGGGGSPGATASAGPGPGNPATITPSGI